MFRTRHHILALLLAALAGETRACNFSDRTPVSAVEAMIEQAEPGPVGTLLAGVYVGNLVVRKPVVLDGVPGPFSTASGKVQSSRFLPRMSPSGAAPCVLLVRRDGRAVGYPCLGSERHDRLEHDRGCPLWDRSSRGFGHADHRQRHLRQGLDPADAATVYASGEPRCTVEGNTVRASRDMVFWYSRTCGLHATRFRQPIRAALHVQPRLGPRRERLYANSVGVYLTYSNGITRAGTAC